MEVGPDRKLSEFTMELQFTGGEELAHAGAELAREYPGHRRHRGEIVTRGRNPPSGVGAQSATADDTVEVIVVQERLAPGVKNGRHANADAEAPLGKAQNGLADCGKEQTVKRLPFLLDQQVEGVRQGEDQMEVRHRQESSLLSREPIERGSSLTLGTVAGATRVGGGKRGTGRG